jgi:hypothetical protein
LLAPSIRTEHPQPGQRLSSHQREDTQRHRSGFCLSQIFGGGNKRPDHDLEVIEFFYASGCELQMSQLGGGREFKKPL